MSKARKKAAAVKKRHPAASATKMPAQKRHSTAKVQAASVKKHDFHSKSPSTRGVCPTCGYHLMFLHGGNCPLCQVCARCSKRVRHCTCLEGQ